MSESSQLPVPKVAFPVDPLVGIMPRAAALLIDIVAIYFAGYTIEMAFREPLMQLGPALPLASHVAAFCYFWLGNGPVGGGTTFGKAILNLHVVTAEEKPAIPGYGASFRRTLLQYPLIYLAIFQFVDEAAGLAPFPGVVAGGVVRIVVLGLLITHGYCMLTHPQRATWYDLWSGLRVTPDPTPHVFYSRVQELSEGASGRRADAQATFSRFFFVAVCLVFSLAFAPIVRNSDYRENLDLLREIEKNTPLDGYTLQGLMYQSGPQYKTWKNYVLGEYVPLNQDVGTTSSLPAAVRSEDSNTSGEAPRPVLFMSWLKQRGSAAPEDFSDLESQIEALKAEVPRYLSNDQALGIEPDVSPPVDLILHLTDRFRFVLFSPGDGLVGLVEGPIDPEKGPLIDTWYEPAP